MIVAENLSFILDSPLKHWSTQQEVLNKSQSVVDSLICDVIQPQHMFSESGLFPISPADGYYSQIEIGKTNVSYY